jgi:hypothetical protein
MSSSEYVRVGQSEDIDHHHDPVGSGSGHDGEAVSAGTSALGLGAGSPGTAGGEDDGNNYRPPFALNTNPMAVSKFGELNLSLDTRSGHGENSHGSGSIRSSEIQVGSLGGTGLAPLSRSPSRWRDFTFFVAFGLHFFLMSIFDLAPDARKGDTVIPKQYGGLWVSMVLTVAVVGMALGVIVVMILGNTESRESFLNFSLMNSIFVRILLCVYFFLSNTALGIIVGIVFALMVAVSVGRLKKARENVNFTSALIELSVEICQQYGSPMLTVCSLVLFVQTCILMAWGVYLVGLLDDISVKVLEVFAIMMVFSLYWTVQFFEAFTSYVIGGCVSWYFLRGEADAINASKRLMLYSFNSLTSGMGTICKVSTTFRLAVSIIVNNRCVSDLSVGESALCSVPYYPAYECVGQATPSTA